MKQKVIKESHVEKILGITFFTVGVLLIVIALVCALFSVRIQTGAEKVTGIIEANYGNGICVSYTYAGRDYETDLSEYSSSMHTGDEIALYVDKENPNKVRTEMLLFLPTFILAIVGAPFLIIGLVFVLVSAGKKKKKQNLLQNGRVVEAVVTGGQINYNVQVNRRHPWKLECKYEDTFTGATYLYSSNNIWEDPFLYIGQTVKVYVDRNNPKKYYVDVNSLQTSQSGSVVFDYR